MLALCILTTPHGICKAEEDFLKGTPSWATEEWKNFASHIVAGEIPYGCEECALVTACTIRRDVERGWNPWNLRQRWYGWKQPTEMALNAVEESLSTMGCACVPDCKFLGNQNDYNWNWSPQPFIEFGNDNGKSVCVLWELEKTESENTIPLQGSMLFHAIEENALSVEEPTNVMSTK